MAQVTAKWSSFFGQTFVVAEVVYGSRIGDGVYLLLNGQRCWFGIQSIELLEQK